MGGEPLRLAFGAREGVMVVVCRRRNYSLRLAFGAREGVVMVSTEGTPPRLAFQAREGVVVVDGRETPLSRILSEGGGGGRRNYSLRLTFGAREGY